MERLEYIEAHGQQFIVTNSIMDINGSLEVGVQALEENVASYQSIAGVITSANNKYGFHIDASTDSMSNSLYTYYNGTVFESSEKHRSDIEGTFHKLAIKKNVFMLDDEVLHTFSASTSTSNYGEKMIIFARNSSGERGFCGRISYLKLWDKNDELVLDLIPMLQNNTAGLYDNISDTFFTNSGGGIFSYKLMPKQVSSIDEVLNTSEGMECLRSTSTDDGTDTIQGVDWFKYNGNVATNLYVSGNMWIGMGEESEHLKPYRRDGKMYYLYRQEGTIGDISFLKVRWEGYTQYNNTSDDARLIYEFFIFSDNRMFLNVVQAPTNTSYLGTSSLVCGSKTYSLPLSTEPIQLIFTPPNENGYSWTITEGKIDFGPAATVLYLIRSADGLYKTDGTALIETEVNAALFATYGSSTAPTASVLTALGTADVLCWTDAKEAVKLTATLQGTPEGAHDIISDNIPVGHSSIYGIDSVEVTDAGTPTYLLAFDGGQYMAYNEGNWTATDSGMTGAELVAIPADAWSNAINSATYMQLKATLDGTDTIAQVKFNFNNTSPIQETSLEGDS